VISKSNHIHAATVEFVAHGGGYPRTSGGVFSVSYYAVYLALIYQAGQLLRENLTSRLAHHVAYT
jgi:hypothetical protein